MNLETKKLGIEKDRNQKQNAENHKLKDIHRIIIAKEAKVALLQLVETEMLNHEIRTAPSD